MKTIKKMDNKSTFRRLLSKDYWTTTTTEKIAKENDKNHQSRCKTKWLFPNEFPKKISSSSSSSLSSSLIGKQKSEIP